jgi:hypothetical protein
MGDLTDLDTSSVGFISYWNAIDSGGVSSIDPSEVTSASGVTTYTLYDNGVEGGYNLLDGKEATFRVKDDGWVIVYLPDSSQDTAHDHAGSPSHGQWDVIPNWSDPKTTGPSISKNALERAIASLKAEFSNSGSMTYNSSDVGLYTYEFTDATNITLFSNQGQEASGFQGTWSDSMSLQYTSDTDIKYAAIASSAKVEHNSNGDNGAESHWDGTELLDFTARNGSRYAGRGDLDGISLGSANTTYSGSIQWTTDSWDGYDGHAYTKVDILVAWG